MIASFPYRDFQFWEYTVSHGSLLIRSPRKSNAPTNIDLIFSGVDYINLPRHFKGIDLVIGNLEDSISISMTLGKHVCASKIFVLISEGKRFIVVAGGFKLDENTNEIFDSPF